MDFIRALRRLVQIALTLASMGFFLALATILGSRAARHERRSRVVRWHLKKVVAISGLRIRLASPLPREGRYLLLANHVSYLDVIAIGSLRPMSFMAKAEIKNWPFIGRLAAMANSVFVDRNSGVGRVRALRHLSEGLQKGPYCVFPEGTTTAALMPSGQYWYRGNVAAVRKNSLPIYTMGLHYSDQRSLAWIDDDELLPHLWSFLQRRETQLAISMCRLDPQSSLAQTSDQSFDRIQEMCRASSQPFMPSEHIYYGQKIRVPA